MAGYDNKPSSDQLRHRLVKLTIRHKEQLLRAEDLRRTFQEAFNDCFKTLEDLIRAPTHDMQAPYIISNGIANVNLQKTCLSPRREQAVRETLCRHSYLAANDPFGPSDLNGFHQVESATGALLALQNDTSASQDRSNGLLLSLNCHFRSLVNADLCCPRSGLTAGIILERLHGTISNMSSDSSIGKVKKRSRIGAQISAAADSRSDADGRCPPAAEGLDSSLAAGIVDMLSSLNDNEASMPAIEQIYSHLVVRERQLVQENLPILQHMHQGHSRAKRSFEVMNNGNSDHAVPFPVTAVASSIDQLAFGIAEDYTAALHNTQVASTGPGTVGAVIASTHQQPSANLQNVLSWLVAWNSKKNNS